MSDKANALNAAVDAFATASIDKQNMDSAFQKAQATVESCLAEVRAEIDQTAAAAQTKTVTP